MLTTTLIGVGLTSEETDVINAVLKEQVEVYGTKVIEDCILGRDLDLVGASTDETRTRTALPE